jgi:ligand-binding sensor domain-containing protein
METIYRERKNDGWKTYTKENSPLSDNQINAVITDKKGQIWIATHSGLNVLSTDGTWTVYKEENSTLYDDDIQALTIDQTGRIWVGTYSGGLYVIDRTGQWINYIGRDNNRLGTSVQALAVDRLGRVWVGTNRGLSVFDVNNVETIYTEDNSGLENNRVVALAVDPLDRIWIATESRTINVLDQEGNWTTYDENSDNSLNRVLSFQIDDQGQVWIGTDLGINVLTLDGNWIYPQSPWESSLSSIYVDAFAVDRQERLWVGTFQELFVVDSDGNQILYAPTNSGLLGWVLTLTVDDDDRLWIGTSNGLNRIALDNLPKPVADDWLRLRNTIRAPLDFLLAIIRTVFFPGASIFAPCYIPLLLLILVSPIVALISRARGKTELAYRSMIVFFVSITGAVIIWVLLIFLIISAGD